MFANRAAIFEIIVACVLMFTPILVVFTVHPFILRWLIEHHPSLHGTLGDKAVGRILIIMLYASMFVIFWMHMNGRLGPHTWIRLARGLVPNLSDRVHQGQDALDAYVRDILEHHHHTGLGDLSHWNGHLTFIFESGLKVQTQPKGDKLYIDAYIDPQHTIDPMRVLRASGTLDDLKAWQCQVVLQLINTPWTSHKPRYSAHERLRLHQRLQHHNNRPLGLLLACA